MGIIHPGAKKSNKPFSRAKPRVKVSAETIGHKSGIFPDVCKRIAATFICRPAGGAKKSGEAMGQIFPLQKTRRNIK